ncbi:MAG TPA: response regulator [Ohtaekwangia sp.]|uniref:response regulator n=1 Tax=Ohtaekwangia sp. TaxID=2066019 RepID=UPI002F9505AE
MLKKILLVDDDQDDADLFCEALKDVNPAAICSWANDGSDLVKKIENNRIDNPDLVFLDINMPQMNGWEVLDYLKKNDRFADVPVIMFSTTSSVYDGRKALDKGALCFYEKPTSFLDLKDFLRSISEKNVNRATLLSAIELVARNKKHRIFTGH